jgi:hypothetical protein
MIDTEDLLLFGGLTRAFGWNAGALGVRPFRRALGDREILLSLHRSRGSLARLRECPAVALTILTDGNVAFTARGHASVVEEAMASSPDYAAVTIAVEQVDDHRQPAFVVDAGVGRDWVDEAEKAALGARVAALKARAAEG